MSGNCNINTVETQYIDTLGEWQELHDQITNTLKAHKAHSLHGGDDGLPDSVVATLQQLTQLINSQARLDAFCSVLLSCGNIPPDYKAELLTLASTASGYAKKHVNACFKSHADKVVVAQKEQAKLKKEWAQQQASTEAEEARQQARTSVGIMTEPDWLHVRKTKAGIVIKRTIANTQALLDAMGVSARYNIMSREIDIIGLPDYLSTESKYTTIASAGAVCDYEIHPAMLYPHIATLADSDQYHPVKEWLDGIVWDGIHRLTDLANQLRSPMDATLKHELVKRWMIGAIQVLYNPEPKPMQGLLILQGGQGIGKTTWLEMLSPISAAVRTGETMDAHNKDVVSRITSHWITELGEIDGTFRKADIAALKAFITSSEDKYRAPYERVTQAHPRRTAFVASVNGRDYLTDSSGNRRFWTIELESIEWNTLDMGQVWAEVKQLYLAGESWSLSSEYLAAMNTSNENHTVINDYEDSVNELYGLSCDYKQEDIGKVLLSTTELYKAVESFTGTNNLTMQDKNKIKSAMVKNGWRYKSVRMENTEGRRWLMAPAYARKSVADAFEQDVMLF